MSDHAPLDFLPLWAVFLAALLGNVAAHEIGARLGRARARRAPKENESPVGGMVAAELGLLAFLLAFTFSIATTRFDARRQAVLDESNAIGTTYLRAAMLPEPHRSEVRKLLREYTDLRLDLGATPIRDTLRRSEALHVRLWKEATAAAGKDARSVPVGLFIASLNDVIDLHEKRVTAGLRSRIPKPVWGVLFAVAALSFLSMGYHGGLTASARSPVVYVVAVTFAAVLWLVADMDRPNEGLQRVSQQPMNDLRGSMDGWDE